MKDFAVNTSGATAIEYVLIATLVSVVIVAGATTVGTTLSAIFYNVSSKLP